MCRISNGPQVVAAVVRQYFKSKGVYWEFSKVTSQEDNSYIQALYSNLQRKAMDSFELEAVSMPNTPSTVIISGALKNEDKGR